MEPRIVKVSTIIVLIIESIDKNFLKINEEESGKEISSLARLGEDI